MSLKGLKPGNDEMKSGWSSLQLAETKTGKRPAQILLPKGFSSRRRIKPEKGAACFHVMSRTVNGEFLFGSTEKEAFRRMMWRMAKFSGVEIFTYVVMDNHFHILLKVPDQAKWLRKFETKQGERSEAGEERLLAHLSTVYSKAFLKQLRNELKSFRDRGMDEEAEKILQRFKKRFCDVSLFVKELKERFSRWYNKQNGRRGTLWMDRFKSVCVEGEAALATMSAYIDLNPVRAGIVDDPMLYEWSGDRDRGICKTSRGAVSKSIRATKRAGAEKKFGRRDLFCDEGVGKGEFSLVVTPPGRTSS